MVPKKPSDARADVRPHDQSALDSVAVDPEELFALITDIACRSLNAPIALIGLRDDIRQWMKRGAGHDLTATSHGQAFCDQVVSQNAVLVVDDAVADTRFHDNQLVVGDPHVRAFAAAPLRGRDGRIVGSLCVMDTRARKFSTAEVRTIDDLAAMLVEHIQLRRFNKRRQGDWSRQMYAMPSGGGAQLGPGQADSNVFEPASPEWIDDVNQVFNHARFVSLGDAEFNRSVRHDHSLALLVLRVDGLKHLSRQVGASAADKIAGALTRRWRGVIRDHDLLGQLGVEKFGVLLPETDTERASFVAKRLSNEMHKEVAAVSKAKGDLILQVGVSSLSSHHHCFDDILSDADMLAVNNIKANQFSKNSVVA